ncbi:MAG: ABC transporter permease subunit [Azospirillaceae bacterium]|nr:ABC transporter permease subunit [Azospirillaceae bacterium]
MDSYDLLFGGGRWWIPLSEGALTTVTIAASGFVLGAIFGSALALMRLGGNAVARRLADIYTTTLRGIPDLLVIYLLYFGGSGALGLIGGFFGATGFIGIPTFATGALALGVVSAAYQAEVFRGAFKAIARGELEAGRACGMSGPAMFRRIVAPQALRFALPGLGNVWQLILKETALISVVGLVELMRAAQVGAGSTRQPFLFYLSAFVLYLVITSISGRLFARAEAICARPYRRA